MSAAIGRLREARGISNNEMARLLGTNQSTAWRYEAYRAPGYEIVAEIEKVLDLSPGTLFAEAGYAPRLSAEDAIRLDPTITDAQKDAVLAVVARAKGKRHPSFSDVNSVGFIYGDEELSFDDAENIVRLVESHRYVNRSKLVGSKH